MPLPLVPLIAAAGSLLGPVVGQGMANRANRRESELAYQRELKMFHLSNAYNSPAEQMKRLQAAGLNPNLVYGSGGQTTGNTVQPGTPRYQPARIQSAVPDFGGAASTYQNVASSMLDLKMKAASIEQVEANTQLTRQRTQTEAIETGVRDILGQRKKVDLDLATKSMDYQYEIQKEKLWQSQAQTASMLQSIKSMSAKEQETLLKNQYIQNNISQQDIDKQIKQADLLFKQNTNALKALGINEGDNIALRLLMQIANKAGLDVTEMLGIKKQKPK